jgi:hypothetical protein
MNEKMSAIVSTAVAKRTLDVSSSAGLTAHVQAILESRSLTEPLLPSVDASSLIRVLDGTRVNWANATRPEKSDGTLAPLVHAALRISPRTASHRGFWLALAQFPVVSDYLFIRWGGSNGEIPAATHLNGDYSHQGLARLWWMAELLRDGSDYGFVKRGFEDQNVPNQAFRSLYFYSRPFARTFTEEVLEYHKNNKAKHPRGKRVDQSAKAVNAALGTVLLESICSNGGSASTNWKAWTNSVPAPGEVEAWIGGELPIGPSGGDLDLDDLRRAKRWMRDFYREWDPSAFAS